MLQPSQAGPEDRRSRAPLPGGSRVVLETDGKSSRTNFSSGDEFAQRQECAGAVIFTTSEIVLRFRRKKPNPQGRLLRPAGTVTSLSWPRLKLAGWKAVYRSSTGTQARGQSRARVTSLQEVSLWPRCSDRTGATVGEPGAQCGPAGISQRIASGEGCAL